MLELSVSYSYIGSVEAYRWQLLVLTAPSASKWKALKDLIWPLFGLNGDIFNGSWGWGECWLLHNSRQRKVHDYLEEDL